jgi:hypothetical protein
MSAFRTLARPIGAAKTSLLHCNNRTFVAAAEARMFGLVGVAWTGEKPAMRVRDLGIDEQHEMIGAQR